MDTQTPNCFHAIVKGRVQGVGYRVFTREAAVRLNCTGWVRNRNDGTVEVYAEGDELTLTDFLTELHKGPPWGHVEDIDIEWKCSGQEEDRFRILR